MFPMEFLDEVLHVHIEVLLSIQLQQARSLAVYPGSARGLESVSTQLQNELQRLLDPAGINVAWQAGGQRQSGEQFEMVVVGSFDGTCSVDELPGFMKTLSARRTLADTSVSRSGKSCPSFGSIARASSKRSGRHWSLSAFRYAA